MGVMGLNQNNGQKILLRLRTDDLQGFRKILSIKKVLYHELAHNVYSNHDNNFFKLNRQIEKECNEWNNGYKSLSNSNYSNDNKNIDDYEIPPSFLGGTGRLGGGSGSSNNSNLPLRELAARSALLRMSEEDEVTLCCLCNDNDTNTFNNRSGKKQESNDNSSGK